MSPERRPKIMDKIQRDLAERRLTRLRVHALRSEVNSWIMEKTHNNRDVTEGDSELRVVSTFGDENLCIGMRTHDGEVDIDVPGLDFRYRITPSNLGLAESRARASDEDTGENNASPLVRREITYQEIKELSEMIVFVRSNSLSLYSVVPYSIVPALPQ